MIFVDEAIQLARPPGRLEAEAYLQGVEDRSHRPDLEARQTAALDARHCVLADACALCHIGLPQTESQANCPHSVAQVDVIHTPMVVDATYLALIDATTRADGGTRAADAQH